MEKLDFNYSMKNIPTSSKKGYKLKLVEKTEQFIKNIRWKASFYLEEEKKKTKSQESRKIKQL